ncbi:glycosyltransferase family 2 protein [Bdellovibrio sp. GT3]|uniref:glycosyltransferase family 2 protein n=1 Tax=Bdellovibrio sp. GT3 TaxID=3136282 RepID=UPI0030F1BAEC
MNTTPPIVAIVSPCYNEAEALPLSTPQFLSALESWIYEGLVSPESFILFVDDGSKDQTWETILKMRANSSKVHGLKLAQNVGHQPALLAGLKYSTPLVDCAISIDADLQDDIGCAKEMIQHFVKDKNDVVYGVRRRREKDTFFKRISARAFYVLMKKMGTNVIYDHADYRLLSRKALSYLGQFQEVHLFLRGLVLLTSKNSSIVYYDRNERVAGESKYPLKKMLTFAWNGITSFSNKPLQMISALGLIICGVTVLLGVYALYRYFTGNTLVGWTSLIISIYFLGGVQLLSLGVIGQYVGKIYLESKGRPQFFIDQGTLPDSSK